MYRILIVDDEPEILKVLETFLIKAGFEVTKALGGEEAINILSSDIKIDLMVLDIKMHGVSGVDVLLKMQKINKKIPTIILSGTLQVEKYLSSIADLGFTREDILYKPVDLFYLLDIVKKKLGSRG
jgi:two-component system response regulator AtoC